jgi:antitoxin VapB
MSHHARLFRNGGSQAVRLPKACRFPEGVDEVIVHQEEGGRIVLELPDAWPAGFLSCLGAWHEPIERPQQTALTDLRDPFA